MKYKTAFRLALKAIGVLLMAQSLPWLVSVLSIWVIDFAFPILSGLFGSFDAFETRWMLAYGIMFAIGLYLFTRGAWIVNRAIPSNRPYCHECGYELTGLANDGVCPECGTPFRASAPQAIDDNAT